jgi:hypothetical protein
LDISFNRRENSKLLVISKAKCIAFQGGNQVFQIDLKKVILATALVFITIAISPVEAKTQKYPKKPGTNCLQKKSDCDNNCPGSNGTFTPTKVRNECLNNCTNSLDLCLGTPARAVEDGVLIEEVKPKSKLPKKKKSN